MTKMEKHRRAFRGAEKPIIGCLHLRALPGTPMWDRNLSLDEHIDLVLQDARILHEAGFDAFVFANESDYPFLTSVGPEIVAAYTRIVTTVMREFDKPFGVGILLDPIASIAVAHMTGASFTRGIFHSVMASDFGMIDRRAGEVLRYARQIGADDLCIYSALEGHFGELLDTRSPETRFREGAKILPFTGYLVGAPAAGVRPEDSLFARLRAIDPETPLILNSGATPDNVRGLLPYCDAVLVGTCLKKDSYLYNPVDRGRAFAFMEAAKG